MDSDKTPGTGGLPAKFYKTFWGELSSILIDALNYGYNTEQLSITQTQIQTHSDSDPHFIKNWRPLIVIIK